MGGSKPANYWKSWDNVEKEIDGLFEDHPELDERFPTAKWMIKNGYSSLSSSVVSYHGGFKEVRERLGQDQLVTPRYHWRTWENVEQELQKIIDEIGHFPTQTELKDRRMSGFGAAMTRHHGGFNEARRRMGYELSKQDGGFWREFGNLEKELLDVIEEIGHFPSQRELMVLKKGVISSSAVKYHGGLNVVRRKMGYETLERDKNYWKDFENVQEELGKLEEELGHLPSYPELLNLGRGDLLNAMQKYHDGYTGVREKLDKMEGINGGKRIRGTWNDKDNVIRALTELTETLGHFPSVDEIRAERGGGLLSAVYNRHGGLAAIRGEMGYSENGNKSEELERLLTNYTRGNELNVRTTK